MPAIPLGHVQTMHGRGLHDRTEPMAPGVQLLAVERRVHERRGTRVHLHAVDHETLDLVHVEALVDPVSEQPLRGIALRPDLTMLALGDLVGLHDQREHAERRLGEGFGARRAPRSNAHVRLGLEVLPAGISRAHPPPPRSPNLACSTAMIAGPAVSVLRMRGPTPTMVQPRACAPSTSSWLSPPSGPTSRRTRAPGARVGGKLAVSAVPVKRAGPTACSSTVIARSQRQSRRSAGSSSARTSASGRGVSTVGTTARPHRVAPPGAP